MKQNIEKKGDTKLSAFMILVWLLIAAILLVCLSFTAKHAMTMTYVDKITIIDIPKYRDADQAIRDEELPTGALYIITGEDYVRIKKYNQ